MSLVYRPIIVLALGVDSCLGLRTYTDSNIAIERWEISVGIQNQGWPEMMMLAKDISLGLPCCC